MTRIPETDRMINPFGDLELQRSIASQRGITEPMRFEDKQDFLRTFKPLLAQVAEYKVTGVLDRAVGLFNWESPRLAELMRKAKRGGEAEKAKFDQALTTFVEKLMKEHPEEWEAWERQATMFDTSMVAVKQGLVTLDELVAMQREAVQEYRKNHKSTL